MGLLNGLSALGASTAAFAGAAGLEAQKASLAQDSLKLADQLATTRESAGRQEAGQIAATAAEKSQAFQSSESGLQRGSSMDIAKLGADTSIKTAGISAGATLGAANIGASASKYASDARTTDLYASIAAAAPEQAARIAQQTQQTVLEKIQADTATGLQTANKALADEMAKPQPNDAVIASAKATIQGLQYSSGVDAATRTAAQAVYHTDMDAVQHFSGQLAGATSKLNEMAMGDPEHEAQKGLVATLQTQLNGAQRALEYSKNLTHSNPPTPANRPPLSSFGGGGTPSPSPAPYSTTPARVNLGSGFINGSP